MARRDDETTWEDFTQRVRRFRPSELTRLIAHVSARQARAQKPLTSPFFPWALSAAATVSLVAGNEHRRGGVSSTIWP